MTIETFGGIKFFKDSKSLYRDGARCTASSGTLSQDYTLNFNKSFSWQSIGSNDSTVETLTINLGSEKTIDRLFLVNHNFDRFTVTYDGGSNFSNVRNLELYPYGVFTDEDGDIFTDESGNIFVDGATSNVFLFDSIDVVGYSKNTSYFEFDSVNVTTIEITIETTQTANAEKSLSIFCVTEEIGTFSNGGIDRNNPSIDYNQSVYKNILNKAFVSRGIETFSASIRIPFAYSQDDVDLIELIQESDDTIILWLCGAHYGSNYFKVNAKPYRLEDVYRVQNVRSSSPLFYNGLYVSGYSNSLSVVEVV